MSRANNKRQRLLRENRCRDARDDYDNKGFMRNRSREGKRPSRFEDWMEEAEAVDEYYFDLAENHTLART